MTTEEVKKRWPDSVRLKMIERSEFYENPSVYQYGFYDGYQMAFSVPDSLPKEGAEDVFNDKLIGKTIRDLPDNFTWDELFQIAAGIPVGRQNFFKLYFKPPKLNT